MAIPVKDNITDVFCVQIPANLAFTENYNSITLSHAICFNHILNTEDNNLLISQLQIF